jgi:hypothetical protein
MRLKSRLARLEGVALLDAKPMELEFASWRPDRTVSHSMMIALAYGSPEPTGAARTQAYREVSAVGVADRSIPPASAT